MTPQFPYPHCRTALYFSLVVRTKRQCGDRAILDGSLGIWMLPSPQRSGDGESQDFQFKKTVLVSELGMARNLTSTLHQPEKETVVRNAPPYRAPVATTPVLRPTHTPQKRELQCPQVSWTYSWHPPSLHLTLPSYLVF